MESDTRKEMRCSMENNSIRHEIVSSNPDIDVRFYLSEDSGSYVAPHWHNSLELVYMIEGSMLTTTCARRCTPENFPSSTPE